LNLNTLHIGWFDLFYLGVIFVGMTFAVLLWFSKGAGRTANIILGFALSATVLPLHGYLSIGPLIYFYVLNVTRRGYRFRWKDLLHFVPLVIEWAITFSGRFLPSLVLVLPECAFLSISLYLYRSQQLIWVYYRRLQPVLMDRPLHRLLWLRRLLNAGAICCLLGLLYAMVLYVFYNDQSGYELFYALFALIVIRLAAIAFLQKHGDVPVQAQTARPATTDLRGKGIWLKKAMDAGFFYRDAELSLTSLAEQLALHPHELSRIINTGLKKNFSDFINELRVKDVIQKMQDVTYDHLTLLGIAFESGFNSKSTFNRIFKQVTGKSPVQYKTYLKKERPTCKLGRHSATEPLILNHEVTTQWTLKKLNGSFMFKNYFKIAFRSLWAKRTFSLINITGLAVGMAGAILIGLWVQNEYSFDSFHTNNKTLYKVWYRFVTKDYTGNSDVTAGPLANALKQEFSEVKSASRIYWTEVRLFNYKEVSLKAQGNEVDKDFLTMFTLPLLAGNKAHAFDEVNSIVLTQHLATKIFGKANPLNQTVKLDNKQLYKVTGVMKDLPDNTQFDFEYLVPIPITGAFNDNAWNSNSYYSYVQLQPNADVDRLNQKLRLVVQKHVNDKNNNTEVFLYPFSKMHLYSRFENGKVAGGKIEVIRLLLIIAGIILLTACINFMNLSTAQSHKRAMEVGVRKVMGAGRISLIGQFLIESLVITLIAGAIGLLIAQLCLPAFNELTVKHLHIQYLQFGFWLLFLAFVLVTGILAGSYPAFFLSAFLPVKVLKGRFNSMNLAINPRKVLVVVQFAVAVVLIVSTIVVYRQVNYAQNRDTGYKIDHLIEIPIEGDIRKNFAVIKNELIQSGAAISACETSIDVTIDGATGGGLSTNGTNTSQQNLNFSKFGTSGDFIKTMGLRLLGGRDLDFNEYPADSASCMLNETAVKQLGIKDPVGNTIYQGSSPLRVVGVFKDFIINSPYVNTNPMIVYASKTWAYNSVIRLNGAKGTAADLKIAEGIFKKYNPAYPFTYQFVDTAYRQKFNDQQQTGQLAAIFACLTIIISCLGLFGLASYMAESRSKEIGIRKVLGASVLSITRMLTREFVQLVLIAIIIAVPIAFWAAHKWLQDFTYRISIGWLTFVIAGLAAIIIAVLTVGFQSVKAAMSNPVDRIRSE
jgi:putative ABC transport system permease protein